MAKDKKLEKGQKRMLHIKIWQNESFATMHPLSRLLYIGLVILADDDGKLKGNSTLLKSQIFPFDAKMKLDTFKILLKEVIKSKLVDLYRVNGEYFMSHPNWNRYQYIRPDLYKPSILPNNPLRNCNETDTQTGTKKRKEKIREEDGISYLSNLPKEDLKEFYDRFDCSEIAIKDKAESLKLWCESNGKQKKNYKAFLLVALKKDFPERKEKPKAKARYEVIDGRAVEITS